MKQMLLSWLSKKSSMKWRSGQKWLPIDYFISWIEPLTVDSSNLTMDTFLKLSSHKLKKYYNRHKLWLVLFNREILKNNKSLKINILKDMIWNLKGNTKPLIGQLSIIFFISQISFLNKKRRGDWSGRLLSAMRPFSVVEVAIPLPRLKMLMRVAGRETITWN